MRNLFISCSFILFSQLSIAAEESNICTARAAYTSNGTFGSYWELEVDAVGELISKGGQYLTGSAEEDNYKSSIDFSLLKEIADESRYFLLPTNIGAEFVPMDGPVFELDVNCRSSSNRVRLYPGFRAAELNTNELNEIEAFSKVWNFLWGNSEIQPLQKPSDEKL